MELAQILPLVAGLLVTVVAMVALRPVAVAMDLLDRPGGHKTHHGDVPIVGGLAMLLGIIVGVAFLQADQVPGSLFLAACTLLVILGLLDDRFQLSVVVRLVTHAAIVGAVAIGSSTMVTTIGDPFAIGTIFFSGVGAYVVTLTFVAGAVNAFNMLDGMDGLAGTMALVALFALCIVGIYDSMPIVVYQSLLVAGAVIGFLIFNLPARFNRSLRCFMGDSGSTLLGFILACLGILVSQGPRAVLSPVIVLWFAAMPIYELLWTIVRRVSRGQSPFRADREHMHHLLLDAGFGVRAAFLFLLFFGVILAVVGLSLHFLGVPDWLCFGLFIGCGVITLATMYRARNFLASLPLDLRRLASAPIVVTKTSENRV